MNSVFITTLYDRYYLHLTNKCTEAKSSKVIIHGMMGFFWLQTVFLLHPKPHRQKGRSYLLRLNNYKKQTDIFMRISLYYQSKLVNYILSFIFYSSENADLNKLSYLFEENQLIRIRTWIQMHSAEF